MIAVRDPVEWVILVAAPRKGSSDVAQIQEHLDATEKARGTVVCLAFDPGGAPQSPSREFMARLAGEAGARRAAECDRRPSGGIEARTGRRMTAGYLFQSWYNTVQTDEWIKGVQTNNFVDMSSMMTFDGLMARVEARF